VRRLHREVELQRALVAERRAQLGAAARLALRDTRRALASPSGLAAGFGAGLLLGLWRGAPAAAQTEQPAAARQPPALLRWALRDLALPLLLNWLEQRAARSQSEPPTDDFAGY